ncbi:hypothetical protein PCASD_10022 [Puccinia coronata f. sp. avenae]|uniref:Uncharacterized protein n=1 Tax=Puccinia coronata f. sp. avenae TaxID=200324 RepID=A0A2N5UJQ2_9BASI|nr:hypothetical protein PCASD_20247 [Puccinia coronata f. sp. avenae]PLW37981.1 hypothetical protein PCASD_10022 [Puccinia coronata f. sp. avenae]
MFVAPLKKPIRWGCPTRHWTRLSDAMSDKPVQQICLTSLPALTGRTRRFEQCSIRRVRPVIGPACPTGWERLRSDMPVRSLVKRGGSTGARPALFDQLMLAECQH